MPPVLRKVTVESEPCHLAELTVRSADQPALAGFLSSHLEGWQECTAVTQSCGAFVWGRKVHPFF